jgi:hypothetical protein
MKLTRYLLLLLLLSGECIAQPPEKEALELEWRDILGSINTQP